MNVFPAVQSENQNLEYQITVDDEFYLLSPLLRRKNEHKLELYTSHWENSSTLWTSWYGKIQFVHGGDVLLPARAQQASRNELNMKTQGIFPTQGSNSYLLHHLH